MIVGRFLSTPEMIEIFGAAPMVQAMLDFDAGSVAQPQLDALRARPSSLNERSSWPATMDAHGSTRTEP